MAFTEKLLFLRLIQAMSSKFRLIKKLDVKVRERYLKKISTIGIDPVLIDGNASSLLIAYCRWNRLICSAIWFSRLIIIGKNNLKPSAVSQPTIKWCRALFATFKDISSEQVRGVAKVRHSQRMNDALIQIWIITI